MKIGLAIDKYRKLEGMVITRLTRPLLMCLSHSTQGNHEYYKKTLKIPACFYSLTYVGQEINYGNDGKQAIKEFLEKQNIEKIYKIIKTIEKNSDGLLKYSQILQKKDFRKTSNKKLAKELENFLEKVKKVTVCLGVPHIIDEVLAERINEAFEKKFGKKKAAEYLQKLAVSTKETLLEKQNKEIEKIAREMKAKKISLTEAMPKIIEKRIRLLMRNFAWLNQTYWVGEPFSFDEYVEKIRLAMEKSQNGIGNKSQEMFLAKRQVKDKNLVLAIDALQELIFIHTYRIEAYFASAFFAKNLLNETAERIGVSFEDMLYLLPCEIEKSLSGKKTSVKELIIERKNGYAMCSFNGDFVVFTGKESEQLLDVQKQKEVSATQISGQIAFSGKVSGEAVIINTKNDFHKAKDGMVLVCPMTTIDFVPLLSKTKAIVTNEGGITCHASIISREMKIPCIIGTKTATKILKDGDLVEVDAEKGIVRKL